MTIPNQRPMTGGRRAGPRRGGMTLTELVVAVSVMAIMILGFSTILAQSQRLVVGAQEKMLSNATAAGIEQVIRSNLLQTTQMGFLAVDQVNSAPVLMVATAGVSQSMTGSARGLCSVVVLGLCDNSAVNDVNRRILFCQGWVIDTDDTAGLSTDQRKMDMANIQVMDTAAADALKANLLASVPASVKVPPGNPSEIKALWTRLATDCKDLTIEWATAAGGTLTWSNAAKTWVRNGPDKWPVAIKISFVLTDPWMPEEFRDQKYEVVCPIVQ